MPISNTSPYVQLWIAGTGGGNGLFSVNGDPGTECGMTGYQLAQILPEHSRQSGTTTVAEGLYPAERHRLRHSARQIFHRRQRLRRPQPVLQGNIADLVAGNPPSLTVLYQDTRRRRRDQRIDNLEIDPNSGLVYFTHGERLEKVVYDSRGFRPRPSCRLQFNGSPAWARPIRRATPTISSTTS